MCMRWLGLVAAGFATVVLGVIFHLQGQGAVGPQSSFMYANQQWIDYGLYIALAGCAIAVLGAVRWFARLR